MASKPYLHDGVWFMKYKPDPGGGWKKKRLGKETRPFPPSRPPQSPLPEIAKLHLHYADLEEKARHGFRVGDGQSGLALYAEEYLKALAIGHDPRTVQAYRLTIDRFVRFCAERNVTDIRHVSRATARDFVELLAASYAPNTAHAKKQYLAPMFSRAVEDEIIPGSPFARLKMPVPLEEPEPTFWGSEEVAAIAGAMGQPYRDLTLMLANTGMRIDSARKMEWSWIDWTHGTIDIPNRAAKKNMGYHVPMTAMAETILRRRMETGGGSKFVFCSLRKPGAMIAYATYFYQLRKAIKKAGVPEGSPHDLRHSFGRHLADVAPINVVQAALGHRSLRHTQRYTRLSAEQARGRMDGFSFGQSPDEPGDDTQRQEPTNPSNSREEYP